MQPLDRFDLALFTVLCVALVVIAVWEPTQRFYALEWPDGTDAMVIAAMGLVGIVTHEVARARLHPLRWRWVDRLLSYLGDDDG